MRRLAWRTGTTAEASFGALVDGEQLPFTGKLKGTRFKIYPVQRGRIMPMPCIVGSVVGRDSGSLIYLRGRPNTSGFLSGLAWLGLGVFVVLKALPVQGPLIASLFLLFPLAVLAAASLLLRRECSMAYDILQADLGASWERHGSSRLSE